MIYAKTLNPEGFDFNAYEDEFNEVFIKGKDYALNDKPLKFIENMKAGYENDYVDDYYKGDMKAYINSTLIDKKDGKPYTEDEAKRIKMALDNHVEHEDLVKLCLGIAMGERYDYMMIQGSTQRNHAYSWIQSQILTICRSDEETVGRRCQEHCCDNECWVHSA